LNDSLNDLSAASRRFADARGWGPFHTPKNLASALAVEAAELLEPFQWLTESQSRELPEATRRHVAGEMADVLLYLVQLANVMEIDLLEAARQKMAINEQRFPPERGG
jgi:NTP pyrophosphatase (non-canonical NTP hydrolase)